MAVDTYVSKDQLVEVIERLKGKTYHTVTAPPVTDTDIRRWAIAVYWPLKPPPIFWDEDYAKRSRWGGTVAPAEFNPFAWPLEGAGHLPVWPDFGGRPRVSFSAGNDAEYYSPIRPGDVITGASTMVDVYEKTGRAGILLFGLNEARLTNQRDELVKVIRHLRVFIFDRPGQPSKGLEQVKVVPKGDPHLEWASPTVYEPQGIYFDDVQEGDSLPVFRRYTDLMNYNRYAAVNDEYVYHHMDPDIANSRGQKDVDGMGMLQFAYLHNMLRQWTGEAGDIKKFNVQYRANNGRGDVVTTHGRVVQKHQENGEHLVDLDIWTQNQDEQTLSPGTATVSLPSRSA